ncbi:MAG: NADH-quinone oxidoreductase subunit A [Elusimicrobia bacterium]|nr:NADH-quinone oxidoreductase subunit A [Elusimicrobiota bacterium]MDE2237547.1 NADH-quinone oxidoreductase subunit A [Elusimicrobiota bacterium]MDE2424760.1 NADH-quinone oxidoreductase subunit A [Elusimicrobiota bacterium]
MTALAMALDAAFTLALLLVFSNVNRWLGPAPRHEGDGQLPYETGMPPIERAEGSMAVAYYRFAVLFVVFDVDLAFLLPWALSRPVFGAAAATAMSVFVGLLLLLLAYLWRKGVLECKR